MTWKLAFNMGLYEAYLARPQTINPKLMGSSQLVLAAVTASMQSYLTKVVLDSQCKCNRCCCLARA